jgi:hypothetical protein
MKVKNLIKQFEQYNQEADVFVNSNFKDIGFTIAYGGGEGVEKENCETVSIYPDNLGAENTNNCASMIYNPKDWGATLGVDSSRINLGYESMQERSYSEEEVKDIMKLGEDAFNKNVHEKLRETLSPTEKQMWINGYLLALTEQNQSRK